jgi:hypothetical protein
LQGIFGAQWGEVSKKQKKKLKRAIDYLLFCGMIILYYYAPKHDLL